MLFWRGNTDITGRIAIRNLDNILRGRDITFLIEVPTVKAIFPVVLYGCESRTIKKAKHWKINAFKLWYWRRLLSLLNCKEINPVNPKGNQPWLFIERTDPEAEAPILWLPDEKSLLTGEDLDAEKDWRQEKRMTEDEMVGWHHQFKDMSLNKLQEIL